MTASKWCVTGVAGFIGSHLLEALLRQDASVVGVDNLSTGSSGNLEEVRNRVTPEQWGRFQFVESDIRQRGPWVTALDGCHWVLHQAAIGSVPRSLEDPAETHETNVTGFLNVMLAAREARVTRVVYASSSAVYGDCTDNPAREDRIGAPLSPYALSKRFNEDYSAVLRRCYGLEAIGLRYFNVFGPRQDPAGAYAAVIPRWIQAMLAGREVRIHGDGQSSRDFCPVQTVVHANLTAATAALSSEAPAVFNVGLGAATTLNHLFELIRNEVLKARPEAARITPVHGDFRPGDVRHSCADIQRAVQWLGLKAGADFTADLRETVRWFARHTEG
ncbi:MAG: NAD-dependent epimerase/dehydratase family protein [Verrucomicrobiales bacterium]|nr:NAD-dependent epimerase/dehydratase family protein [Verrucomicrobiales bacterium]